MGWLDYVFLPIIYIGLPLQGLLHKAHLVEDRGIQTMHVTLFCGLATIGFSLSFFFFIFSLVLSP